MVGWLDLEGAERVLDAGCGTGRVTALLLERLPRGRVVALDGSTAMIDRARERFAGDDRVEFVVADLLQPLPIDGTVDAILSTATFHWIADHDALFRNLAAVLGPGGQLAAQCGGAGNIANLLAVLEELGHGTPERVFASAEETRTRLVRSGFVDVQTWLHDEPTRLAADDLDPYLATICLGGVIEDMEPAEAEALVHAVAERLRTPQIDYVRLNIRARRG